MLINQSALGVVIMHILHKFNMWATLYHYTTNLIANLAIFGIWGFTAPAQWPRMGYLKNMKIGLLTPYSLVFGQN
jgi:hypothetical protein